MDINERDWKLFRKYLPDWQENYMEKLIKFPYASGVIGGL
jgi:hypothetical protein